VSGLIDARGEAWTQRLSALQASIDSLLGCPWFDPESFDRSQIVRAVDECMPDDIQIGRFEYTETQIIELVRRYVATNAGVNIRNPAPEVFVHISRFNPEQHCHRPWEYERLAALFRQLLETCAACAEPPPEAGASSRSPCCDADG
jgi:hypothetical protein